MGEVDIEKIKWNQAGLIPAILQDYLTGTVLMLAYMNREALQKTLDTREAWFWSRSRQKLWKKGESSGNIQKVVDISLDCDQDTLLVKVNPLGPACHLGTESCFGSDSYLILEQLAQIIAKRFETRPEKSYTTYLFTEGIDKILKKVGEESAEVIIAAKNQGTEELAQETADLIYHLFVLLQEKGLSYQKVLQVLKERQGKK